MASEKRSLDKKGTWLFRERGRPGEETKVRKRRGERSFSVKGSCSRLERERRKTVPHQAPGNDRKRGGKKI